MGFLVGFVIGLGLGIVGLTLVAIHNRARVVAWLTSLEG